jgi:hypothetical protein
MASQSAAQAAQSMSQMASQMESQMAAQMQAEIKESMSKPGKMKGGSGGFSKGKGDPFTYKPGVFQADGQNSDWARIKGRADSGAFSDQLQNIPPEYRELVRRYFVELAQESSSNDKDKDPGK